MNNKLKDRCLALNDSAMQQKCRRIRPWPVGAVFIEQPGMTMDDIRAEFRRLHELGFNATKQICLMPETDQAAVMYAALDEGIIPWWYGEGGWEDPTPELLAELGIDPAIEMADLRKHPVWLKRQDQIMRKRIAIETGSEPGPVIETVGGKNSGLPGELNPFSYELDSVFSDMFCDYLREKYGTVENLCENWNFHHCLIQRYSWKTWDDVRDTCVSAVNGERREYARMVDLFLFKAKLNTQRIAAQLTARAKRDPNAPLRAGGEVSVFHPLPCYSVDMEQIASCLREVGSYYPSMHLSWHFQQSSYEALRPLYIQSQYAADCFKGGWSATWESTAGPQMLTGGKPTYSEIRDMIPGATVDEGVLTQIMLSWIAAGFRGFGLWCANVRTAGWEAGEYGLFDRDNEVTPRAIAAGRIGQTCQTYRDELWEAQKTPTVGVVMSSHADTYWAAVSMANNEQFRHIPTLSRIGAGRALINRNIPWEFVTTQNLFDALAARYDVLYFPAMLSLDARLLPILQEYCEQGGKVVIDAPTGWYDEHGRLLTSAVGSDFERLFGARLANFQYATPHNRPWKVDGHVLEGFMTDIVPTTAEVIRFFDDGKPMITRHAVGKGNAVILGTGASLACHHPDHAFEEALLCDTLLAGLEMPYHCDGAIVYRLSSETADHYFLLNENEIATVSLKTATPYRNTMDAMNGEAVSLDAVTLPGYSGRWIRCEK